MSVGMGKTFKAVCLFVFLFVRSITQQKGWLSPTERASVSAISLRHIISLRQESLKHILASPEYAPWTITVNFAWFEREFNAYQTPRSMYPSIFNRFPVIQAVSLKVRHFSTFFAHLGLPWVRPWDNCGKCYMNRKRIHTWNFAKILMHAKLE